MNEQEIKETLEQQMRLLSKSSKIANSDELFELTQAMVMVHHELLNYTDKSMFS